MVANQVLSDLLRCVGNPSDYEGQQEAILQLGMLLEMRVRPVNMSDPHFYERLVSARLRAIPLTDDDQEEIVSELCRLILSPESARTRISLLSALASASPSIVIAPILDLFL